MYGFAPSTGLVEAWVNGLANGEVFGGDRPPLATGSEVAVGDSPLQRVVLVGRALARKRNAGL